MISDMSKTQWLNNVQMTPLPEAAARLLEICVWAFIESSGSYLRRIPLWSLPGQSGSGNAVFKWSVGYRRLVRLSWIGQPVSLVQAGHFIAFGDRWQRTCPDCSLPPNRHLRFSVVLSK